MDKKTARTGWIIVKVIDFFLYTIILTALILGWKLDWTIAFGLVFFYGVSSDLLGRFSMDLKGHKNNE